MNSTRGRGNSRGRSRGHGGSTLGRGKQRGKVGTSTNMVTRSSHQGTSQPPQCAEEGTSKESQSRGKRGINSTRDSAKGKGGKNVNGNSKTKAKTKTSDVSEENSSTEQILIDLTTDDEESLVCEELVMSVFQNELIFNTIGSFLNFGDLQTMSRVSKCFYNITHSYRPFTDRVILKLSIEGHNRHAYTNVYPWKSVICFIENLAKPARFGMTSEILYSAEHLELVDHRHATIPVKYYTYFFTKSPHLKSLTLDCSILNRNLRSVLGKKQVIQNLSKLDKFCVTEGRQDYPILESVKFIENIRLLLKMPWNLKNLTFGRIDIDINSIAMSTAFVEMIEKNKNSLRELSINGNIFRESELKSIVCPNLSVLEVTVEEDSQDNLVEFLKIQPLLTSLSIRNRDGINKNLLNIIQEKCGNLIKLRLKTPHFIRTRVPPPPIQQNWDDENELPVIIPLPEPMDITFLGGITTLVEFDLFQQLSDWNSEYHVTIAEALSALPNTHLKSLSFSGMNSGWIGEETLAAITCFSRFPNLTQLCLLESDDALNNEILQFIISTFTLLKVFCISRSSRITGVGLTGINGEIVTGLSLKNLKGLKRLAIVNCQCLEENDYVSAVQFLELIDLDIRTTHPLPTEKLVEIIAQNPSLERVCTNTLDYHYLKTEVKALNTRIKPEGIINKSTLTMYSPVGSTNSDSDGWSDEFDSSESGGGWDDHDDFDDFFGYGFDNEEYEFSEDERDFEEDNDDDDEDDEFNVGVDVFIS